MGDVSILLRIYVWRACLDEALTENAPSAGERRKKEKALISQDFFGLVVATGLEPVTPSM